MFNKMQKVDLQKYFGDFGGMLIPDSFIPDLYKLAEEAKEMIKGEEFRRYYRILTESLPPMIFIKDKTDELQVTRVPSQALYYIVSGYIAFARAKGSQYNYVGVDTKEMAAFVAESCQKLNLGCSIILEKSLANETQLIQKLRKCGAEIDGETCARLYNRPQAYAFQKYLGNRQESSFIPVGTHLGPYPFPALGEIFAGEFGRKVRDHMGEVPDVVAATMLHGNAAVAAFAGYRGTSCRLVTVEGPMCQEYNGEFCGCSLLMARPAEPSEYAVTLCPQISNMWRMAEAIRLGTESYIEGEAAKTMTAASARAIRLINLRIPEAKRILIVEGENE